MRIIRTAEPTNRVITLSNAKTYLNINFDDSDPVIKLLLDQATAFVEAQTGYVLREATYQQFWDYREISNIFELIYAPTESITEIYTYNQQNQATLVDPTTYYSEVQGKRVYFEVLPSDNYRPIDSISITYKVNPTESMIPVDLLLAVYDLTAYYFDNRGNPTTNIPQNVVSIINSYKETMVVSPSTPTINSSFNIGNRYFVGL